MNADNGYPLSEDATSPELQAFEPKLYGDFTREQNLINDWANADRGYAGEAIAMSSIAGIRAGIDMARRVSLEHENRAAAARSVEQRLREELTDAAQHRLNENTEAVELPMTVAEANARISRPIGG